MTKIVGYFEPGTTNGVVEGINKKLKLINYSGYYAVLSTGILMILQHRGNARVGIICAVISTYLSIQRMGLLGDVIAHAVLPGLGIAFFVEFNIFVGEFMI